MTPAKIGLKKDLSLRWYTVATFMFARATGLSFLTVISAALLYVALIAWGITFIGMARELASMFVPRANVITRWCSEIHSMTEKSGAEAASQNNWREF